MCFLWQGLSDGTILFEDVTLTMNVDLLLKNFNICYDFSILWEKAFIFGMSNTYDETFLMVP